MSIRTVLALLVGLACAAPAAAQHRVERSAALDADGEFRVWNYLGSVRVVGWDVDSVRVEGTMDDVARAGFSFGVDGGSGKTAVQSDGHAGRADLLVHVPRGATVWIKTLSAPVVVSGVHGRVDVYSVSGAVHIETSASSVYAESMGGRVRVVGSSSVVRLRSGSGALEFDGGAADLSLTSVSGAITARASGLRRGIVETVGGDVRLGVSLAPDASLEVLSHDGDVDLTLPVSVPANFLLRTVSGAIRNPLRAARGADRNVEIRTFSGAIVVREAP